MSVKLQPSRASTASSSSGNPLTRQNTMSSQDGSRSARQSKRYSMSALYMSMSANEGDLQIDDDLARGKLVSPSQYSVYISMLTSFAAQKILRELKSKISSQSKKNFVLEKDVRYLDSRIALLIQNRMALEEVRRDRVILASLGMADLDVAKRSCEPPRRRHRHAGRILSQRRQDSEIWQSDVSAAVRTSPHCPSMPACFHD